MPFACSFVGRISRLSARIARNASSRLRWLVYATRARWRAAVPRFGIRCDCSQAHALTFCFVVPSSCDLAGRIASWPLRPSVASSSPQSSMLSVSHALTVERALVLKAELISCSRLIQVLCACLLRSNLVCLLCTQANCCRDLMGSLPCRTNFCAFTLSLFLGPRLRRHYSPDVAVHVLRTEESNDRALPSRRAFKVAGSRFLSLLSLISLFTFRLLLGFVLNLIAPDNALIACLACVMAQVLKAAWNRDLTSMFAPGERTPDTPLLILLLLFSLGSSSSSNPRSNNVSIAAVNSSLQSRSAATSRLKPTSSSRHGRNIRCQERGPV